MTRSAVTRSAAARGLRPRLALSVAAIALAGCAGDPFQRDPKVSDLTLDASTMAEAGRVQVPMPDPEPYRAPTRAEAASLWQRGSRGFFGDQRASRVGDLLTVTIEIKDEAQLENESDRSRSSSTSVDTPSVLGLDVSSLSSNGRLIDLNSESAENGQGSIQRNETISLKIAALVTQKLPNGNFVIAGRQEVKVNHELRELRVAGIIRPVDIEMDNTVPYDKIAEARITYGGRGQLSKVQQPRYGSDALDVVLPY
ncbi:flagellar basal body L-ring protein FlgH [Frigidibacter sp. MR17.24]|uniref:flagellar basal body L-ring protein FlgH n=1 Tax=Frigidibacter sp. MR17.24 TaxID=3127345 RepID=UPI003012B96A